MRLVLTGTPGTGKTALAEKLCRKLDCKLLDANAIAKKNNLVKKDGTTNIRKLEAILKKQTKSLDSFIAEGHLLCEFPLKCDACVVLRCNPKTLARRLKKRGYSGKKLADNVLCEALDYCLVNAEQRYPKVVQIDFTRPLSAQAFLARLKKGGDRVAWKLSSVACKTR